MNRSGAFFVLPLARSALEVMHAELGGLSEDAVVVLAVVPPVCRAGLIAANDLVLAVDSHLISGAW